MKLIKATGGLGAEQHGKNSMSDVILGGQDGLVNVLGVLLGVAAASQNTRIVLAAGLAATFAESISMAAVAYTSTMASRDFYQKELEREKSEIMEFPEIEEEEVREIYRRKGFKGKILEEIVQVIISDEKIWLDTMMNEELQLSPIDKSKPLRAALIVGFAAIMGSLIPLLPFFFVNISTGIYVSIGVSAVTLFIIGAVKARLTVGNLYKSGIQMAVIGTVSALAGYLVGMLFNAPSGI
jgi:VIT1/CCC1 family predicted Fe2+/Mn2+ transporter